MRIILIVTCFTPFNTNLFITGAIVGETRGGSKVPVGRRGLQAGSMSGSAGVRVDEEKVQVC